MLTRYIRDCHSMSCIGTTRRELRVSEGWALSFFIFNALKGDVFTAKRLRALICRGDEFSEQGIMDSLKKSLMQVEDFYNAFSQFEVWVNRVCATKPRSKQ